MCGPRRGETRGEGAESARGRCGGEGAPLGELGVSEQRAGTTSVTADAPRLLRRLKRGPSAVEVVEREERASDEGSQAAKELADRAPRARAASGCNLPEGRRCRERAWVGAGWDSRNTEAHRVIWTLVVVQGPSS